MPCFLRALFFALIASSLPPLALPPLALPPLALPPLALPPLALPLSRPGTVARRGSSSSPYSGPQTAAFEPGVFTAC